MTATLFEIGENFSALEDLLLESGGELSEEVESWLAEYGELEAEKLDRYALFIRSQEIAAAGLREEETRLADKRRARENSVKRLKDRLKQYMELRGVSKLAGKLYSASIQRNGSLPPVVALVAPEELPERFRRVSIAADNAALREALAAGDPEAAKLASLGEVGCHLRIR